MTYTFITLAFVGLILFYWLYVLVSNCFRTHFSLFNAQKNGLVPVMQATILSTKTLKPGKHPWLEIQIVLENFVGHTIHRTIRFRDNQPQLERFVPDKVIHVGLDLTKRPHDPVLPMYIKQPTSMVFVLFCSLLTIGYIAGCYFLVGEALSRIYLLPKTYERVFATSAVWQLGLAFVVVSIVLRWLLTRMGLFVKESTKLQNWDLFYKGLGTTAIVKEYRDTGILINENPKVEFLYTFMDYSGQIVKGKDQKVVEKLKTAKLSMMSDKEIMYLPDDPSISRMLENLGDHGTQKTIGFLYEIRSICLFGNCCVLFLYGYIPKMIGSHMSSLYPFFSTL
ncbi:hypothetical protein F8C76_12240 [Flagellimonas olearia]|uniref:Uncharacterized protein n=1 Tax=Flagellimonas olearia TaxID=552546 RepID=A0A6I1DX23_9FLAO|nr:hypothetical protein [Allomuricauda olearia]KAB7528624.1 hypothetical protein F8C76_12240 [Allomuricauda olearia]